MIKNTKLNRMISSVGTNYPVCIPVCFDEEWGLAIRTVTSALGVQKTVAHSLRSY